MTNNNKKRILHQEPFYIIIFTDGGPDHKNTNIPTKGAILGMVLNLGIASAVAFRNVPVYSWINPVEHVMILLNLALHHCGYSCESCSAEMEKS